VATSFVQAGSARVVLVAVTHEVDVAVEVTVWPGAPVPVVVVMLVGIKRQLQADGAIDGTVNFERHGGLGLG
jgi:hypothetical protein